MTIGRRAVLRAAVVAVAGATIGEPLAGCDAHHSTGHDAAESAASSELARSGPASNRPASSMPATNTPASSSAPGASNPPASTPRPNGPAVEIVRGPSTGGGVALTFHGAGDPALATALLSEVEATGAHVTVLAVGTWLEQQPQMAKRILDAGHELGNHTYRHLTMPPLSASVDDSEITRCAEVLRKLTGTQGKWFRPSGTVHATAAILAAAGRAGYANSLSYDVDPSDYADPGAAAVVSRVLAKVQAGSIVSLHLGHAGTVQAMPRILDGLKVRGLKAVTMSSLMGTGVSG